MVFFLKIKGKCMWEIGEVGVICSLEVRVFFGCIEMFLVGCS